MAKLMRQDRDVHGRIGQRHPIWLADDGVNPIGRRRSEVVGHEHDRSRLERSGIGDQGGERRRIGSNHQQSLERRHGGEMHEL